MVTIVNLAKWPVWLTLTSGQALRLAPGEVSAKLKDVEVKNNPKVEKLQQQRVIAVHGLKDVAAPAATVLAAGTAKRKRVRK